MSEWNQAAIERYISDAVEESLTLDYKGAGALERKNKKKDEITKDVSAMANSAGGLIIYGVREYNDQKKKHLPEKIDAIDRTLFSKEWLEQIINTIQPRIDGIIIHPVEIDTGSNAVVYVVEIPQSTTAHQARDKRYYKRFNFQSLAMEDYELRDVTNRVTTAQAEVEFELSKWLEFTNPPYYVHGLRATVKNNGQKVIDHFKLEFTFPYIGLDLQGPKSSSYWFRDIMNEAGVVEFHRGVFRSMDVLFPEDSIGIGTSSSRSCFSYRVDSDGYEEWMHTMKQSNLHLEWVLFADDMPPKRCKVSFAELYE